MLQALVAAFRPNPPPVVKVDSCRDCADYLTRGLVPHHRPDMARSVAQVWAPAAFRLRVAQNPDHFPGLFSTMPCATCCAGEVGPRFRVDVIRR